MVPKACMLYFACIELVRYMHTHIPVYVSMHDQCLGEDRFFLFDLSKPIKLCKNSFLGGPCKVVVVLGDRHSILSQSFLYQTGGAASGSIAIATRGSYSNLLVTTEPSSQLST